MADYRLWLIKPDGTRKQAGGIEKYEEEETANDAKRHYEEFFAGTGITVEMEVLPE